MILLHVGPGPSAPKMPQVARNLAESGHQVEVILNGSARQFVGPAAFAPHAKVVETASEPPEALVFAPATAGTVARLARGLGGGPAEGWYADGVRPVVVSPELDRATSEHPAVRENLELLLGDGCRVLEGEEVASPLEISGAVLNSMGGPLSGVRVLVTAGGTREPIDRVRFVGNRSSGKMGKAVAREAYRRGAEVAVVAANVAEREPGVRWVEVETYAEVEEATTRLAPRVDVLVMAAAISDFTPRSVDEGKIRRGGRKELDLKLVATGDILAAVRESNEKLFMVGFAATFGDPVPDAREKLAKKGVDLVVGNDISFAGTGFGSDENEVHIVGPAEGFGERFVSRSSKAEVAREILDAVASEMGR